MKKFLILLSFLLVVPIQNAFSLFQRVEGVESTQIKRIVISSFNPAIMYIASDNSLYKSQDSGENFKKIAVFKDEDVQHIFLDPYLAGINYVVTSRHLYRGDEQLSKLFSASDEEVIYSAAKYKGYIYVGTSQGLYFASEDILKWERLKALDEVSVYHIEPGQSLYLSTGKGVYLFKERDIVERVFSAREDREEGENNLVLNIIKKDDFDKSRLWLGTNKGMFFSQDNGLTWNKFYAQGVDSLSILAINQTKFENNTLYIGTPRGFFKINIETQKAKQIFEGVNASKINWVEFSPEGGIYLATSNGAFKSNYFTPFYNKADFNEIVKGEPSINQVQQAALKYNGVHPNMIKKWRNALKYRALFPGVSVDYDKVVTYDSGSDRYYVGPYDWGINFSWDVGDLIWNSYEDDVDTRARLDTQLRLDILDEINRVYFERLRLKREIVSSNFSEQELFSKQLRLQELTAILNGYTGGILSLSEN